MCERSLCSLLSCCPFCSLYALTVSPCLHTAGVSPWATARSRHSAFGQMASWSPHRDWTLDTESVWVCVLVVLPPACLFCHLVCELHATDGFCALIWRLISLVQSEYICRFSVISMEMHVQAPYERRAIRYTCGSSRSILLCCTCCISFAHHRGCCGFMLNTTAQVFCPCPCFVISKEADEGQLRQLGSQSFQQTWRYGLKRTVSTDHRSCESFAWNLSNLFSSSYAILNAGQLNVWFGMYQFVYDSDALNSIYNGLSRFQMFNSWKLLRSTVACIERLVVRFCCLCILLEAS